MVAVRKSKKQEAHVRQLPQAALISGTVIFAIWCVLSLGGDLARLSLGTVLQP